MVVAEEDPCQQGHPEQQKRMEAMKSLLTQGSSGAKAFTLSDFLREYVPTLPSLESLWRDSNQVEWPLTLNDNSNEASDIGAPGAGQPTTSTEKQTELCLLWRCALFVPTRNRRTKHQKVGADAITLVPKLTKIQLPPTRSQSLPSLIQDCIATLLQSSTRNVLCLGYELGTEKSNGTRLWQRQLNAATEFGQAHMFPMLHSVLGDDVMRFLLLHTSIFVPLSDATTTTWTGNYWQIAGPPFVSVEMPRRDTGPCDDGSKSATARSLQTSRPAVGPKEIGRGIMLDQALSEPCHTARPTKRRRVRPIRSIPPNSVALAPASYLRRQSLFHSHTYTAKVGQGLLDATTRGTAATGDPTLTHEALWKVMTSEYMVSTRRGPRGPVTSHSSLVAPPTSSETVQLCREIQQRHERTDYHRLLRRHCPLPEKYQTMSLDQLSVQGYSSTDNVIAFVQSCVKAVIPSSFWCKPIASKGQKRKAGAAMDRPVTNETIVLQQTIPVFVVLRRHEHMTNTILLQNLRLSQMSWLDSLTYSHVASSRIRQQHDKMLVLSILRWLFHSYIIPLLQQAFYVTECEFHNKRVMFYRKPVWALFRTLSMNKVLGGSRPTQTLVPFQKSPQYSELMEPQVAERLCVQRLGLSRLRLVPKATGVRPIAMLSKREPLSLSARQGTTMATTIDEVDDDCEYRVKPKPVSDPAVLARRSKIRVSEQSRLPTNVLLRDIFAVLSYEYSNNNDLFGYGLMGMHNFYARYRDFLSEWKGSANGRLPPRKRNQLYFGSVDIRHCYDNIDQNHLLSVIDTILTNESYVIQKYTVTHATDGTCRVQVLRKRDVGMPDQFESFADKVLTLAQEYHGAVFVDGVNFVSLCKQQIMDQLREHLNGNMVVTKGRFGNRYLLQTKGIPQGSILSTLLCNFYYGDIERRLLAQVSPESGSATQCQLVTRMVDDFLFVTTELNSLTSFFTTMHRGDTARGVEINREKTNTSVDLSLPSEGAIELKANGASSLFSWCGMLLDTTSGEVRIDYSRFFDNVGSDGLPTMERVCLQAGQLGGQMQRFVRPRCISILFDPFINSLGTQALNYYQMMAYGAIKAAEHLFGCGNKLSSQSPVLSNPQYLIRCVQATIEYSYGMIQSQLKKSYQSNAKQFEGRGTSRDRLRLDVAAWLGWHAFFDVFQTVPRSDFHQLAHRDISCMMNGSIESIQGDRLRLDDTVISARASMNLTAVVQSLFC